MTVDSQADLRLLPLAIGLWLAESATLACSGQPSGPSAVAVASACAAAAFATIVVIAVGAGRRYRRVGIEQRRWSTGAPNGAGRSWRRSGWEAAAGSAALGLVVGAGLAGLQASVLQADPIPQLVHARAVVNAELVIDSEPVSTEVATNFAGISRRWRLRAHTVAISEAGAVWRLDVPVTLMGTAPRGTASRGTAPMGTAPMGTDAVDPEPDLHVGMRASVLAAVLAPQPARPQAMRLLVRGQPRMLAPAPWWQRGALAFRESMRSAAGGLPADAGGLLPGLVVGDDSRLAPQAGTAMRTVGMSHLTAVSGSNLAIVTGLVLLVLRRVGVGRKLAVLVALVAMVGFVLVVGPQPSVLRAAIMATIALACLATGRPRAGSSALVATVVLLLLVDPWLALNWGFALSVAATAGLLAWSLHSRWKAEAGSAQVGQRHGWRQALRRALLVAAVCELATAPFVAAIGGGIPLVGILANAAAAPAVPIATVLGLAAASVGLIWPAAAGWLAVPAGYAASWIITVARFAAAIPGGVMPWPSGPAGGVSLAAVLVITALVGRRIHRRYRSGPWANAGAQPLNRPAVVATAMALVAVATLLTRNTSLLTAWPPKNWLITFCDVGQGDAAVLRSSPNHAVVIDAGPEPRSVDRCLRDLHIDVIDFLVLTHFHADHVEGLPGVLDGRPLGRVLVSPLRDPPLEARRVDRWLEEDQRSATVAPLGESGQIGDVGYRVVWPSRIIHDGSMPNNASVALVARIRDLSVFLPGDLEAAAQRELISSVPSPDALVTKIPHHGSRNQDPDLVRWTKSRIAVASVGRQNMYGHPSAQTLDDWRRAGAIVERTDLDGDVIVWRADDGSLKVRGRSDPE